MTSHHPRLVMESQRACATLPVVYIFIIISMLMPLAYLNTQVSYAEPQARATPLSLAHLERSGALPLVTITARLDRYPQVIKLIQKVSEGLPLPPMIKPLIDSPDQLLDLAPQLSLRALFSLLDLSRPLIIGLGEVTPGAETWRVRHRAIIPSADPTALTQRLSELVGREPLPADTPVLGARRDGRAWKLGAKLFVAIFPERDGVRVEVAVESQEPTPLDVVTQDSWARTPAVEHLLTDQATIGVHLKTWRLREYALKEDHYHLNEAVKHIGDPIQAGRIGAYGTSRLLLAEHFSAEVELEGDDLSLALQLTEIGVQVTASLSLTSLGERATRAGVRSGDVPNLSTSVPTVSEGWIKFDVEAALAEVNPDWMIGDRSTLSPSSIRQLTRLMRKVGPLTLIYNIIRRPLGILKLLRTVGSRDYPSMSTPLRGALFTINAQSTAPAPQPTSTGSSAYPVKAALALSFSPQANGAETLTQLQKDQWFGFNKPLVLLSSPDAHVALFDHGEIWKRDLPPSSQGVKIPQDRTPEAPLRGASLIGAWVLHDLKTLASSSPQIASSIASWNWGAHAHLMLERHALTLRFWLGELEAPTPSVNARKSEQGSAQERRWSSPLRMTSPSPQDQCMRELRLYLMGYLQMTYDISQERLLTKSKQSFPRLLELLQCPLANPRFTDSINDSLTQLLRSLFSKTDFWDYHHYQPLLKELCELKLEAGCQAMNTWGGLLLDRWITLPANLHQCSIRDHDKYPESVALSLGRGRGFLDGSSTTPETLIAQLKSLSKARSREGEEAYMLVPEVGGSAEMKMGELFPWFKQMTLAGVTHIIAVGRSRSGAGENTLNIRVPLQIAMPYRGARSPHRHVTRSLKPDDVMRGLYPTVTFSSDDEITIKRPDQADMTISFSELSGDRSAQVASLFNDGVVINVHSQVTWSKLMRVASHACSRVLITITYPKREPGLSRGSIYSKLSGLGAETAPTLNKGLGRIKPLDSLKPLSEKSLGDASKRAIIFAYDVSVSDASAELKQIVQKILRRAHRKYQYCYDRQRIAQPDLKGRAQLTLKVMRGAVLSAELQQSTLNHPQLERCIAQKSKSLFFPGFTTDQLKTVKFSLRLKSR